MPVILHFDLSAAQAPPRHLLEAYTGASPEIADTFFAIPGHEANYQNSLRELEDRLGDRLAGPPCACVAVLVNCRAGMHRSVAMAERLAGDIEDAWRDDGVIVVVEHLDTDVERGIRRAQRARAGGEGYHAGYLAGRYSRYQRIRRNVISRS